MVLRLGQNCMGRQPVSDKRGETNKKTRCTIDRAQIENVIFMKDAEWLYDCPYE